MQVHQRFAPRYPLIKFVRLAVAIEGQAGKLPFQVQFVFGAVGGVVQYGIGIMEYIFLADIVVLVMRLKLLQSPIRDIIQTVAVGVVPVEG